MNILSHPVVQAAAVQASDLVPLLKDSFETFSLLHQSSQISTKHPNVGAYSTNGYIYLNPIYYQLINTFFGLIGNTFGTLSLSGLFLIPMFFWMLFYLYIQFEKLFKIDTTFSFVTTWVLYIDTIVNIFLLPFGFFGSFIFGLLWFGVAVLAYLLSEAFSYIFGYSY